jgi:hypothetical protein
VTGRVTNPSSTITALTANSGDSFAVRSFRDNTKAYLLDMWAEEGTVGIFRITSPNLHDQSQALRFRVALSANPLMPYEAMQPLQQNDVLTVALSGGGSEIDVGAFLVYYADLPGSDARLATWEQIAPLIQQVYVSEQQLTSGGTGGQYGGSQAINTNFDNFLRNKDYALLGYIVDTACAVVGITGGDTGNYRVGGPGPVDPKITREWFVWNSIRTGLPMIPIFNAANVGGIVIDLAKVATSTAVNVSLIFAELATAGGELQVQGPG